MNYSMIDLIKNSVNHFSKDHISLGENKKEENSYFVCQYSKHLDDLLETLAAGYVCHKTNNEIWKSVR